MKPEPVEILLVEDNPNDAELTLYALGKNNIGNRIVVMLTSSREEGDIVESYRLGANSYIVKPVDFEHFMKVIQELHFYWLILNQKTSASGSGR